MHIMYQGKYYAQRFEYDACRIVFNKFFSLRIFKFTISFSMKMKLRHELFFLLWLVFFIKNKYLQQMRIDL